MSCFQGAAAAGRKLLQNSVAVFLQGTKTGTLKPGLISCFFHAEDGNIHTSYVSVFILIEQSGKNVLWGHLSHLPFLQVSWRNRVLSH